MQSEVLLLLLLLGETETFTALKVPRQCPFVLLVKVAFKE